MVAQSMCTKGSYIHARTTRASCAGDDWCAWVIGLVFWLQSTLRKVLIQGGGPRYYLYDRGHLLT